MDRPNENIKIVTSTDVLYSEALQLRNDNIKIPLGLKIVTKEDIKQEGNYTAFVWQDDDGVLYGCCHLHPQPENKFRLRQMAVSSEQRGKNIGKKLVEAAEAFARKQNATEIYVHGKKGSHGFYQKCGFQIATEEIVDQDGISYFILKKQIG